MDEVTAWLLSKELGRDKLALLVLCTLSISVLAAQLAWRLRRPDGQWGRSWVGRWFAECLKLCFYVGLPLTVLARGALVREMGLPATLVAPASVLAGEAAPAWHWVSRGLAWIEVTDVPGLVRLGTGLAVGVGACVVLVAMWVWYARTVLPSAGSEVKPWSAITWWDALRQALLAQFLWAFYRGFALLVVPQRAQAALLALALISVPWALHPQRWHDLRSRRGHWAVLEWMLALLTGVVSLATQQLWFLIGMHVLWLWLSGRLLAHLSERLAESAVLTPAS